VIPSSLRREASRWKSSLLDAEHPTWDSDWVGFVSFIYLGIPLKNFI
jgi:hypothetical protein